MEWAFASSVTTGNDVIASTTVQYRETALRHEQLAGQSSKVTGSRAEFTTSASAHAQSRREATTSMDENRTVTNSGISAKRSGAT